MSRPPRARTPPRAARLRRRGDFTAALASGAVAARRYFTLYARANARCGPRLGIIASRKAAARAVDRNRAKRIVRELFRAARAQFGDIDVVVQLRRCPARGEEPQARAELQRLLAEVGQRAPAAAG